jgi:Zn-dependent protease with chaperone function
MIRGKYFAPASAVTVPAAYDWQHKLLILSTGAKIPMSVEGFQGRHIYFDNGASFVAESKLPEAFVNSQRNKVQQGIAALELFSWRNVLLLMSAFVVLIIALRLALVFATPVVVNLIPMSLEREIGEIGYNRINSMHFEPSRIPLEKRLTIIEMYKQLHRNSQISSRPELFFHASDTIGANALAFPGGPIVVTDDLVNKLAKPELVAAVLAHELAHIEERHSMQQIVLVSGSLAIASVIFGAEEGISEDFLAAIVNLYAFQHSQDFELASDAYAHDLLAKAGFSQSLMSEALATLLHEMSDESETSWFSTHPAKKERLEALEAHSLNSN